MASNSPKRKPIDLRILQREAALKRLCTEKGQPEKYVAPSVSLDCEESSKRRDRRRNIRISLMSEEEKRQRLEKKRIGMRDKREHDALHKNSAIKNRKRKQPPQKTTTCKRCFLNKKEETNEPIYNVGGWARKVKANSDDCKCKPVLQKCHGYDHFNYHKLIDSDLKYGDRNGTCDVKEWSAPPYCKDVISSPKKQRIEITGGKDGHLVFASGMTQHAEYITENLDESFLSTGARTISHHVHYCKREMVGAIKHKFSLTLDNLKANSMQHQCNVHNILECEIRINGIKIGTMMDCKHTAAELIPQSDDLLITHQFTFEHGTTPWGWYECFSLNLIYGPLPKDIKADLETNPQKLDNFNYTYITRKGISSIKFRDIRFRQSSMRWDVIKMDVSSIKDRDIRFRQSSRWYEVGEDILHFIAWKSIYERKERKTITDLEATHIRYRIEDKRKKNKYWLCVRGFERCHKASCSMKTGAVAFVNAIVTNPFSVVQPLPAALMGMKFVMTALYNVQHVESQTNHVIESYGSVLRARISSTI